MAIAPKIITIPRNFTPRDYQIPLYNCLAEGYKRGLAVWHRRAGKDKVFVNILARESIKRVGTYFYILPYYKQARAIIWEGMDKTGFRLIEHIPKELWVRKDKMCIRDRMNPSASSITKNEDEARANWKSRSPFSLRMTLVRDLTRYFLSA